MGVASLVLGIIALVISLAAGTVGWGWVGSICGIIAVVLGAIARKNPEQKGVATGGLVCGIIALVLGIVVTVACVVCAGAALGALNSL